MKRIALLTVAVLVASPLWGSVYFYGGDFSYPAATARDNAFASGLPNENDAIVSGNPYGATTYQNFVAAGAVSLSGLFTNNLSQLTPTSGYWEVRKGVSEGNGGTLIASGSGSMDQAPTGRSGFGFTEYRDSVPAFVTLPAGTYWFAVVPQAPTQAGRSFNTNTTGRNSVGTTISNEQYFNSAFFGANFTNANNVNNEGDFPIFSSGVLVTCSESSACSLDGVSDVPEPSSFVLLGTGLVGAAVAVRRRFS